MVNSDTFGTFAAQGLPNTQIPNSLLGGQNAPKFNASIIRWDGRVLLAYRAYRPDNGLTAIYLSTLGKDWMPLGKHWLLDCPSKAKRARFEDQRFFVHKKRLWVSCSEVYEIDHGWACCQQVFRLDDNLQVDKSLDIHAGHNFKHTEKNWTFFSKDDRLYCIYDVQKQSVFEVNDQTGKVVEWWDNQPRFHWPWGHLRGGNSPEYIEEGQYKGYLTFLHSATAHIWKRRRYSMTAAIINPEAPFNVGWLSGEPLCYGTRAEDFCGSGNGQCVFPCGMLLDGDTWHVAAGVNDTFNTIFHLDKQKVLNGLVPAERFLVPQDRYWVTSRPRTINFIAGPEYLWETPYAGSSGIVAIMKTDDPIAIADLQDAKKNPGCAEIPRIDYEKLLPRPIARNLAPTREEIKKHYQIPVQVRRKDGIIIQKGAPAPVVHGRRDGRVLYQ